MSHDVAANDEDSFERVVHVLWEALLLLGQPWKRGSGDFHLLLDDYGDLTVRIGLVSEQMTLQAPRVLSLIQKTLTDLDSRWTVAVSISHGPDTDRETVRVVTKSGVRSSRGLSSDR